MTQRGAPGEDPPLVSVVVPVYNAERYLRQSLDSIAAQTYPNFEVVVADDASTDRSPEIAEDYAEDVRIVRRDGNLGQFPNVADGIRRARGDFVCVFHADDVYHPEILERLAAFLRDHPEVGAVFSQDVFIDADGRAYGRLELPAGIPTETPLSYDELLRALMLHRNRFLRTPGTMVRAELYEEAGPFREERFGHAADLDMWLRIARRRPVAILSDHLFRYRHTPDSVVHSYLAERSDVDTFFDVVETHVEESGYAPPAEAAAAFRAHREEDRLLLAAAEYVRGDLTAMRTRLGEVDLPRLWSSDRVQRPRLTILFLVLQVLARLPRVPAVAEVFDERWGGPRRPGQNRSSDARGPA